MTPPCCPDCAAPVAPTPRDGEPARYCARCGQELQVAPPQFGELASQLIGDLYSFELPILRTARDLLRGPGKVADAWLAGRRRTYLHPVKFIVILGVVVALAYPPLQELRSALLQGSAVYQSGLAQHSTQYFGLFSLALLIPISILLRYTASAFGVRRGWLEWYAVGLYCYGLATILQLVIDLVGIALPAAAQTAIALVTALLPVALMTWGAYGFVDHNQRWRAAAAALLAQLTLLTALVFLLT